MGLSDPQGQFGVHSICLYDRETHLPLSYLRVVGECSIGFEAEFVDLEGGSQLYSWDSEVSKISSDISLSAREYDPGTMELLMGGALTENAAEATGAVEDFANINGTSVLEASTGVASVDVTSGDHADLKEGKYILKATSADELSLYGVTDVDFKNGTDIIFSDDTLLIESGLDLSVSDAVIAEMGITLTKGSGTCAFTIGDTAEFYVRKVNTSSIELLFGQHGAEFQEVGAIIAGQKQADGTISYMELYKCKVAGMPISFSEKAWSEWSITMKALYDSEKDAVGKFRRTVAA